ncbi:sulfatase-like hydrolase/transferase [Xanthobacter sp. KR7-65]|uniref:arylsulfatase n=1 Tax=Xanthobacter sp. KR7-65 TaxID=3156612 RepID=UPI0032B3E738
MTDTPPASAPAAPNRRDVLAGGAGFLAAIAGLSLLSPGARAVDAPRPHILYIVADDLGFADVGFQGSDIRTPNLDALAAGGAKLSHFYTQPFCTPTRAALLTGRYPMRYGLQVGAIPSGAGYGLATDEFLLPQALKAAGYRTAIVGKWHLGHADRKYWPRQRGFDYFYGPLVGEIDHFKHEAHGVTDWYRDNTLLKEEGYDTELFGAEAVRQIAGHDPKTPLFLYLAFTAPHTPYQAPQRYLDQYAGIADPERRAYAAMITAMDEQIGKVVTALDARGLRENTLIVFHSDNGGTRNKMFAGEGAVAGDLPPSNAPLREGKGSVYEGGTRVVALANWPGRIAPGTAEGVMHVVDMLPTLARLAGADLGKSKSLDGGDVWPALAAGQPGRAEVLYNVDPTQGAVREGDFKLVWHVALPPKVELFDLAKDPSEKTDLSAAHPEKVAQLQQRVVDFARTMAPPLFYRAALKSALSAPLAQPGEALYEMGLETD